MKKLKGFTLIELLVVIAIIGILASIVLVSLAGARDRAKNARIQADLSQLRSLAEMYHEDQSPGTYNGLENNAEENRLADDVNGQDGSYNIYVGGTSYCAGSPMHNNYFWCVDSHLRSGRYDTWPTNCNSSCTTNCSCE